MNTVQILSEAVRPSMHHSVVRCLN
uniref:Uncharacterized protein n=1 Tax=Anguilla anguilla TaxID=7936 RepID=A0A0E9RN98_ANGAN